jgi:hypothetical protein
VTSSGRRRSSPESLVCGFSTLMPLPGLAGPELGHWPGRRAIGSRGPFWGWSEVWRDCGFADHEEKARPETQRSERHLQGVFL